MSFLLILLLLWMPPPTPMDLTKRKKEQRTVLKFLSKTGAMPIEYWCQMQAVFGQETMSKNWVRVWFKHFKEEQRNTVADDPRPGRKCTARTCPNVDAVQRCLHPD